MTSLIYNQDCVGGMYQKLTENSIDLCVTSIPFGALFMYSGKPEDIGNNHDGIDMEATQFGLNLRFFIGQLFRVMKPGCNACIHIQQLLTTKVQHGYMGRRDFRGAVVEQFTKGGFDWKGEFVIPKNPQAAAQRLKLHSLLFETAGKNGRHLAPFMNDYVMIFQKPGESVPVPCVRHLRRGQMINPGGWLTSEDWIRDASGVWDDIRETDVLEGYRCAREDNDEKHVCPLQLEVIRRLVRLYSNPGETILDPFIGIGSTGYVALEQGRQIVGFEIKESYWRQAVRNIEKARQVKKNGQAEMILENEGAGG